MLTRGRPKHSLERLETRTLLDAHGVVWGADARLSLSFAPDGTEVGPNSSQLFASFDTLAPSDQWQEAILRGFQTWAQHTNADVGVVDDDGSPFGTNGATSGDARFGDIRITAIPMAEGLFATSVPTNELVDGTWVGEVFFNSQADIGSLDDLFAIALHEAGHVFGLEHTNEHESPLFTHGLPETTKLTQNDIRGLQRIYGTRSPDAFEDKDDDDDDDWAVIELDDDDETAPGFAFADIGASDDVDLYEVALPDDDVDRVRVQLFTDEISLLRARLTVENDNGDVLGVVGHSAATELGQVLEFPIEDVDKLMIRVAAEGDAPYHIGGYTVAVSFPGDTQLTDVEIEAIAKSRLRDADQEDIRRFLRSNRSELLLDDEVGANDQFGSETELLTNDAFDSATVFVMRSSLAADSDVDRFKFKLPKSENGNVLIIGLNSLSTQLRTQFGATDADGNPLPTEMLVNSDGTFTAQIQGISVDQEVVVVVRSHAESIKSTGNYELLIRATNEAASRGVVASGSLNGQSSSAEHFVYIDRPQLFQLGVEGTSPVTLLTRFFDGEGELLAELVSSNGDLETRTMLLLQGTYRITVSSLGASSGYTISAETTDVPLGLDPIDPTQDLFCIDLYGCLLRIGDLNRDGRVDFDDFLVLGNNFGKRNAKLADGDLDGDGTVGFGDFLILTNSFGRSV